jgi:hypothetical protein
MLAAVADGLHANWLRAIVELHPTAGRGLGLQIPVVITIGGNTTQPGAMNRITIGARLSPELLVHWPPGKQVRGNSCFSTAKLAFANRTSAGKVKGKKEIRPVGYSGIGSCLATSSLGESGERRVGRMIGGHQSSSITTQRNRFTSSAVSCTP